jgi:hypothetical protein
MKDAAESRLRNEESADDAFDNEGVNASSAA